MESNVKAKLARDDIKEWRLWHNYGITLSTYNKILDSQDGKCRICETDYNGHHWGHPKALSVDHDHKTGLVRGLLCSSCNYGLGVFKDDQMLLASAAEYLQEGDKWRQFVMDTRVLRIPIYNKRFPTSVDYEEITVPRGTINEQRKVVLERLRVTEAYAAEGMKGYEDTPGDEHDNR